MLGTDPSKPVDWYLLTGILFVLIAGGFTMLGDRVCFLDEPRNDFQRVVGLPTLIAYHFTHERPAASMGAFIFWGILFGLGSFAVLRLLIKKVLIPNHIRSMIRAERQQEYLKNRFRGEIPEEKP